MAADPAPAAPRGRPSTYDPALGLRICERIMDGETLGAICDDEEMPGRGQVLRWLAGDPDFRLQYRQAVVLRAELMAEDLLRIADGADATKDGVMHARLRIDTRKYLLARCLPRVYGRIEDEAAPASPDAPQLAGPAAPRLLTPQQRAAVYAALQQKQALQQDPV